EVHLSRRAVIKRRAVAAAAGDCERGIKRSAARTGVREQPIRPSDLRRMEQVDRERIVVEREIAVHAEEIVELKKSVGGRTNERESAEIELNRRAGVQRERSGRERPGNRGIARLQRAADERGADVRSIAGKRGARG